MAKENRDWGYDRIAGALANLGYKVCDQTVGNVLQRHALPPAPERKRTTTWAAFIRIHLALLAGTDFFTAAVLTLRGLVPYYVLFFMHLESRRVDIAGVTVHPDERWMQQIARNVTMEGCGALRDCRYLLHDRDTKTPANRAGNHNAKIKPTSVFSHSQGQKRRSPSAVCQSAPSQSADIVCPSAMTARSMSAYRAPVRPAGALARISHTAQRIGAGINENDCAATIFRRFAERPDADRVSPGGRAVVAAFDAGAITSDAGALLLGATDRAIRMMDRLASCFHDVRCPELIEHEVATLVGQRVFGIALGYEDLNDHDELRHDPMLAVLAGKLEARREDCAPVAGKSTLLCHLPMRHL